MSKSKSSIRKFFSKTWYWFALAIILLIFLVNQVLAILLAFIFLVMFFISFIPSFFFKNKLVNLMKKYKKIEEPAIVQKLHRPKEKIRKSLFKLSRDQKGKKWVLVFLNKRYVFYNEIIVKKFLEFYSNGHSEKEILAELRRDAFLKTRAEIKAIETTLKKHHRLIQRRPPPPVALVKESKQKQRN